MLAWIVLSVILVAIALYFWKWKKLQSELPSGPTPLPIIGNLHQIDENDPRKTISSWHKQFGPIFTVWMGLEPQIFVTGYDTMKHVFINQGNLVSDRHMPFSFETFTNGRYGIATTSGEHWVEQRRFSLQTLRNFGFGRSLMEDKIKESVENLIDNISSKISNSKSAVTDIEHDIVWCLGNIISSLVLGKTYPQRPDNPIAKIRRTMDEQLLVMGSIKVMLLNAFPALRFVPLFGNFGYKEINEGFEKISHFLKQELELHKRDLSVSDEPNDFVTAYLQELRKREKSGDMGYFSERQLLGLMLELIVTNIEDPVKAVHWAILLMINYPEIQKKVQQEIDSVVPHDGLVSLSDRSKMPYTNAVLNEVQRYANTFPLNFARIIKEATVVDGITLPKNVVIVPQISAVLHDEKIFANPLEFLPERFLENDGKSLKKVEELIPFSLGKRSCMGESLARSETFLMLASLLQKFTFSSPHGEDKPSLVPLMGFTLGPKPYMCTIAERN